MSSQQLVDRMLAAQSNVDAWKLRTGRLSREDEFQSIRQSLDELSKAPIFIDDQPGDAQDDQDEDDHGDGDNNYFDNDSSGQPPKDGNGKPKRRGRPPKDTQKTATTMHYSMDTTEACLAAENFVFRLALTNRVFKQGMIRLSSDRCTVGVKAPSM